MKKLNLNTKYIHLVIITVLCLTGCSTVKPQATNDNLDLASKRLAIAEVCFQRGKLDKGIGNRFQGYVVEGLNNYQYDNSILTNKYTTNIKEINNTLDNNSSSEEGLSNTCNTLKLMTLKEDQQRLKNQQAKVSTNEALASLNNSANSIANAAQNANKGINYNAIPVPNYNINGQLPSNNTQGYLINSDSGLIRKTCTGSGSFRYCF